MSRANPFGQKNDRGACTCAECGRRFGSLSAFDWHRVMTRGEYDWTCATDVQLAERGLALGRYGMWRRRSDPNVATQDAIAAGGGAGG